MTGYAVDLRPVLIAVDGDRRRIQRRGNCQLRAMDFVLRSHIGLAVQRDFALVGGGGRIGVCKADAKAEVTGLSECLVGACEVGLRVVEEAEGARSNLEEPTQIFRGPA